MIDPKDITFSAPIVDEFGTTQIEAELKLELKFEYERDSVLGDKQSKYVKEHMTNIIMTHIYGDNWKKVLDISMIND